MESEAESIIRNDTLERVTTDYGYFDGAGTYHAYVKDHQGNVRAVVAGGEAVERDDYYPYGMPIAGACTPSAEGVQPLKYTSKELDRFNRLDWYDSHARMYDAVIGRTPTMDAMAEKYYSISPYAWCAGNPIKYIDPMGNTVILHGDDKLGVGNKLDALISFKIKVIDNKLSAKGPAVTDAEVKLQEAINDKNVIVNIYTTTDERVIGGYFAGNAVENGTTITTQVVNLKRLLQIDNFYDMPLGTSLLHELLESYIGGTDHPNAPIATGTKDANGNIEAKSPEYLDSHDKAKNLDPRFIEPDFSIDPATNEIYLNKDGKEEKLK